MRAAELKKAHFGCRDCTDLRGRVNLDDARAHQRELDNLDDRGRQALGLPNYSEADDYAYGRGR